MKWAVPPKIKVYEALGCIADKRIEIEGNEAKIYSSSKGKYYSVKYDGENAIMCNDNGSYWVGYLGYPAIAFLMLKNKIRYSPESAEALKDIAWKDVNVKFKNDFDKTEEYVLGLVKERGYGVSELISEVNIIFEQIKKLSMDILGQKVKPPSGY